MQAAHDAPRCTHIARSGKRCAAPAMRGRDVCVYHKINQDTEDIKIYEVEDATSFNLAANQVIKGIEQDKYDHRKATLLVYALQVAASNLKRLKEEQPEAEGCPQCLSQLLLAKLESPLPPVPLPPHIKARSLAEQAKYLEEVSTKAYWKTHAATEKENEKTA